MQPERSVVRLGGEERVSYGDVMVGAQLYEPLSVLVQIAKAEVANAAGPGIEVKTH